MHTVCLCLLIQLLLFVCIVKIHSWSSKGFWRENIIFFTVNLFKDTSVKRSNSKKFFSSIKLHVTERRRIFRVFSLLFVSAWLKTVVFCDYEMFKNSLSSLSFSLSFSETFSLTSSWSSIPSSYNLLCLVGINSRRFVLQFSPPLKRLQTSHGLAKCQACLLNDLESFILCHLSFFLSLSLWLLIFCLGLVCSCN